MFYENLVKMAEQFREEDNPDRLLSASLLKRVFPQSSEQLGDGLVNSSELRRLEARYRTPVNLALEEAIAGAPQEEQNRMLVDLIHWLWGSGEEGKNPGDRTRVDHGGSKGVCHSSR